MNTPNNINLPEVDLSTLPVGGGKLNLRLSPVLGDDVYLPASYFKADDGLKVVICAGMHGNEWTGIRSIFRLQELVENRIRSGTLLLVPVLNPFAFEAKSRNTPIDCKNLNREFHGLSNGGTLTVRLARELDARIFSHADVILDLHSGGEMELLRHVRVMNDRSSADWPYLGVDLIQVLGNLPAGFLCKRCEERGQAFFTFEIGAGYEVDEGAAEEMALRLADYLEQRGMLETGSEQRACVPPRIVNDFASVTSPASGLWLRDVSLGVGVEQGSELGRVLEVSGGHSRVVTSPDSGIVLSLRKWEAVSAGEQLAEVAFFSQDPPRNYFRTGKGNK